MTVRGNIRLRMLIDLDVVTVAFWEKKDKRREIAIKFIDEVKENKYEVYTLLSTLKLIDNWRYNNLGVSIRTFYSENTDYYVEDLELYELLTKKDVNAEQLIQELEMHNIKKEDILLILTCSLKELDYLVTSNRKHLKNNEYLINQILKKYNLKKIKVVFPNEI